MLKEGFQVLKQTVKEWSSDKCPQQGAALAFYTTFSLSPLLVVVIGIAGLVLGRKAVEGQLVGQLEGLMGAQGAEMVQTMIANASKPSSGIIATVVGLVGLLFGATGVFGQLQTSLNDIFEVKPRSGGFWGMIRQRLLSFSALLGLGFLLLVSLVLQAALAAFAGKLGPAKSAVGQILNQVVSLGVTTLLFALIFKILPQARIRWRGIWIGALFTAVLFGAGRYLIGLYLGRGAVGSAFGAAGSLAIVLLWIYYSAQILFFGAEFTQVLSCRKGWVLEETATCEEPETVPFAAPVRSAQPARSRKGFALGAIGFLTGYLLARRRGLAR